MDQIEFGHWHVPYQIAAKWVQKRRRLILPSSHANHLMSTFINDSSSWRRQCGLLNIGRKQNDTDLGGVPSVGGPNDTTDDPENDRRS